MHLPLEIIHPDRRDTATTPTTTTTTATVSDTTKYAAIIGVAVAVVLCFASYMTYHKLRALKLQNAEPRWIPTAWLKNKWRKWSPSKPYKSIDEPNGAPLTATRSSYAPTASTEFATSTAASDEVDRRQSVRSIMTLPPYRLTPLDSEQLIAREGERAGIDTVVELPESEAAIEERREAEMAALFNIRQARRREQAEREERRQERQRAREAGDWERLRVMEEESRQRARIRAASEATLLAATTGDNHGSRSAASSQTNLDLSALSREDSAYLIAELAQQREDGRRSRRVSSVSYADLGLARHDGSRIRADSMESDNRPLLDSAASMGGSRAASRASSPGRSLASRGTGHRRHASDASMGTVDSYVLTASRTRTGSDDNAHSGALLTPQSSMELPPDPPSYDDDISIHGGEAPPYESPVRERAPEFPNLGDSQRSTEEHQRDGHEQGQSTSNITAPPSVHTASEESPRDRRPPQLRMSQLRHLPAIEVLSATPINSAPSTPRFEQTHGVA